MKLKSVFRNVIFDSLVSKFVYVDWDIVERSKVSSAKTLEQYFHPATTIGIVHNLHKYPIHVSIYLKH